MVTSSSTRPHVLLVTRAIVINEQKQLLLIKRSLQQKHNQLLWESPGGKLEEGQDIAHSLEREVLEETGLLVMPLHKTAYIESEMLTQGKYAGIPYIVLVGIARIEGDRNCRLSEEHTEYKWVKYEVAIEMELTPETRKAFLALKQFLT